MAFCSYCGKEVPPQATSCPNCGHPAMQTQPAMRPGQTTASDVQVESAALSRITWYAILQIAGVAGSIATYILFIPRFFSRLPTTSGTASASDVASWLQGLLSYLTVVIAVTFAIGLIAVFLLLSAFRRLSKLDGSSFSTPATLTILLLVGMAGAGVGLIPLFGMLSPLLSNIAQNPTYTLTGGQVADLSAAAALIVIGGILSIIGVIGGEIFGLWRVGTRYDSTAIKISAISIVIPYLNWVGPVLLLVGVLDAKNKLERQSRPQFAGSL